MKNKKLWCARHFWVLFLVCGCAVISLSICAFFLYSLYHGNDFHIKGASKIEMTETGQVGDFIGGVIGTIVSFVALVLVLLTYLNQKDANEKNKIDGRFFNLINIHKLNVDEMEYVNPYNDRNLPTVRKFDNDKS